MKRIMYAPFYYGVLALLSVIMLLPIIYALFGSFKPLDQLMADGARLLPRDWQWGNYPDAWRVSDFSRYFNNTIIVTGSIIALDTCFSAMFGYVLARKPIAVFKFYEKLFIATMFLGFGTVTLYPKFMISLKLGMLNIWGIIVVEWAGLMVVHILLIKAFCLSLNREMYEASAMDGCGFFRTFRSIAFPLMRPILATTAILAFQAAWNNFQIPYVFTMSKPELRTLVVGLYALRSAGGGSDAWNLMMAGTMMSLLPIIGVFIVLQKFFMRGFAEGSVKG